MKSPFQFPGLKHFILSKLYEKDGIKLKNIFNMTFKKKFISSIKWTFTSQLGLQLIQLISLAILARLLSPKDFGLVSMVTVIINFLAFFKDLGTSSAIIQQRELSDTLLSSIF